MNDPFELPSLEEIEQMDSQKSQAIEALEISNYYVKCQKCGIAVPMLVDGLLFWLWSLQIYRHVKL
ncbi:MAG TPA: hypothetical protein VE619_05960 [Nitrososphaeraceae archaeon]|nr:hypothetical protein [Nitrososphaeraceae archaeon]